MQHNVGASGGNADACAAEVLIYVASLGGHRESYLEFLSRVLNGRRTSSVTEMLFSRAPVLFATIEGSFGFYLAVCTARAVLGRRTVGLLLRPGPAVSGKTFRLRAKRAMLGLLRGTAAVQTLTILPFAVDPRFEKIAHGWIYDPQLWDLDEISMKATRVASTSLASEIKMLAAGRRLCVAVGRQDEAKGFDTFAQEWLINPKLRQAMLFAAAGRVSEVLKPLSKRLSAAGGYSADRLISDEELLSLYAVSDVVWCAYSPVYDQASGIFGRAVQFGLPVVVRSGSYVHRLCELEGIPHTPIGDRRHLDVGVCELAGEAPAVTATRVERMRTTSTTRLWLALKVPR